MQARSDIDELYAFTVPVQFAPGAATAISAWRELHMQQRQGSHLNDAAFWGKMHVTEAYLGPSPMQL